MSDLKPCPKCDSDSISITSSRSMEISMIFCGDCGHSMQRSICEDKLEILWNASYAAEAQRRTQPEATAPAQDLSAAILALKPEQVDLKYQSGHYDARHAAAALASSANALSAGDRAAFIDNHKLHISTCYEEGDSQPVYEISIVHGDIEDDSLQCIGSEKSLREAIDAAILHSKQVGNHG